MQDLAAPFKKLNDNSFDIIVCVLAKHYIKDWSSTIQEFNGVLKENGQLIILIYHPFFEFNYFNSKYYFNAEAVKCIWKGLGNPVEINSYRRSLESCIMPLKNNGFYTDLLMEPKPTKEFEKHDPKYYKELNKFPAFMCIKAIRKQSKI